MSCPMKRWKVGSCQTIKQESTEQSKELEKKLAQMRMERSKVDAMWEKTEEGESLISSNEPTATSSQAYIRK
jgi:hypothetical protein